MSTYSHVTETRLLSLIVGDLFELSGTLRRVETVIAGEEGQTHARWQVLRAAAAGNRNVSQIARRLGVARQGVHRIADLLVDEGLAAYRSNPGNARSPHIRLTAKGKRLLGRLEKRARVYRRFVAKQTSKRNLAALRGGLQYLSEVVDGIERA